MYEWLYHLYTITSNVILTQLDYLLNWKFQDLCSVNSEHLVFKMTQLEFFVNVLPAKKKKEKIHKSKLPNFYLSVSAFSM